MNFITKELIDKGWSGDKKYCVTDEQGNKYLFRVSPIEQYERKKSEYELMQQVAALGVPMSKPLEFGTSDEGVYSIQTWIDGVDAEENAHNLTSDEQYSYGFEAGRILKEIEINSERIEIDLNTLSSGVYYLKVFDTHSTQTIKIIKE